MVVSVRKYPGRAVFGMIVATALLCSTLPGERLFAQETDGDPTQSLTLDELEAYIAEQQKELEKVMANREITESKAVALEKAVEKREAHLREVEAEVQALCEEREAIESGSLDSCLEEYAE